MNNPLAAAAVALLLPFAACASEADRCRASIPPALSEVLHKQFPGFRLPLGRDESQDVQPPLLEQLRKLGANGCMSVAVGDYNGDKQEDRAVLLVREAPGNGLPPVRLVVALREREAWRLKELPTWCPDIGRCHVATVAPGTYRRSSSMDDPLQSAEKAVLVLKNQGVAAGTIEATEVVYGIDGGEWRHVWYAQ